MKAASSSEMLVNVSITAWHQNPEDHNPNLKSYFLINFRSKVTFGDLEAHLC
jgi:hypothetical protein